MAGSRVPASSRKAFDLVRRQYRHAKDYWEPQNLMYGRLMGFCLDLVHYKQHDPLAKEKSRQQPKTQRQFNLVRHKSSMLLREMTQFDTRAVQPGADSAAAEISRRIIEQVFSDPLKGYHEVRSRFVWSALAGGRGCLAVDWHPKWGVCFRFVDPRRLHIPPGFTYLHDPRNPAVYEEVPMRLSEVRKMKGWDVPSDLAGDGGSPMDSGFGTNEADGLERDRGNAIPGNDEDSATDPLVTVVKAWYKDDPFSGSRASKKATEADLPESEWYWVDDQTRLRQPFDPMSPVPPVGESGGMMRLVTRRDEDADFYDQDDGYLIITAPAYGGEKPLFEGGWTDGAINQGSAGLSAFPYAEMVGYKHPLRRTGISDTELTHSLTIVDNATFRQTYEQMMLSGGILVTKPGGLKDSEGKAFRPNSEPISLAYAEDALTLEMTKFIQTPGMNSAMPQFRDMIEGQWQHIGTGDFAANLGPERSKDIAVGTANLLQQTGDLPVQLHAQDLSLQEAIIARVALDYCRAYMGDQVVSWVSDSGEDVYASVRGDDLVPLNVTVRANKEWRQQDVDRVQATAQLLGMIGKVGLPPNVTAILLRESGISANVVTALTEAMAAGPAMPGNTPPGPGGQPPPGPDGSPALSVVQGGMQP